jgi:uncharacterized membrane protein
MGSREDFLLDEAERWVAEGLITEAQYGALRDRYAGQDADVRKQILVRASLAIGVVLVLLGTARLLADMQLSFLAWTGVQAVLSALAIGWGLKLHRARPAARAGQALIYLGAMFYLGAIGLGGYTFEIWNRLNSPWLFLLGGVSLGAFGLWVRFAKLHTIGLVLATVAAGIWLHRAGMPIRWTPLVLGLAVAGVGFALRVPGLPRLRWIYVAGGLAVAALAGWSLELGADAAGRWPYALLFTALAAAPLVVGLRERDDVLAGMGILLLVLDVYTQYYFLFWGAVPKTVFFLVGGLITLGFGIAYERKLHGQRPSELGARWRT